MSEENKNLIGIKVKLGVQELINENEILQDNIYKLQDKLQQKENIIKEAREYTSKTQMPEGYKKMILEMLDNERESE